MSIQRNFIEQISRIIRSENPKNALKTDLIHANPLIVTDIQ